MTMPSGTDSKAVQLFDQAGWLWSDAHKAFVESRNPERETTDEYLRREPARVGYGELRDHGLAGSAPLATREAGLRWLHERLSAAR